MNICILGWYGTETLGDRAILEGIIKILEQVEKQNNIFLGSLYPFFSERTLLEEKPFMERMEIQSSITLFDERSGSELRKYIRYSDLVIMGGGPLMDILEVDIIDAAFSYAKKLKKQTGVIGCGIGPLNRKEYRKSVYNILKNSDISIFRDSNSLISARTLNQEFGKAINEDTLYFSSDPAVIPIGFYKTNIIFQRENQIVVNLRDLFFQIPDKNDQNRVFEKIVELIKQIASLYNRVILLPNHTFFMGGDDRLYLSKIKLELLDYPNISVVQQPKSLFETIGIISQSKSAIAMRYHAILFQTLLNGNNYILDYTDKKNGKIISFLKDIDTNNFYKNRYYSISSNKMKIKLDFNNEKFQYDDSIFKKTMTFYADHIKAIMMR